MHAEHVEHVLLEYDVTGEGEPVILLHARPFVDWYTPLVSQLADVSVLRYRRRVDPDRVVSQPPFGIADDAAVIEHLLDDISFERPHLVGHSYGGLLALELSRRGNIDVRSLALLEPAAAGFVPPEQADAGVAPLLESARIEGPNAAMHRFLAAICGDGYAGQLDAVVPSGLEIACRHAEQFFGVELPAVAAWDYGAADAAAIDVPVLVVAGTASGDRFVDAVDLVQSWIAHAQRLDVAGATHLLMAEHPTAVAAGLATFWRDL